MATRARRYADANPGMLDRRGQSGCATTSPISAATRQRHGVRPVGRRQDTLLGMPAAKGLFHKASCDERLAGAQPHAGAGGGNHGRVLSTLGIPRARLDDLHTLPMRRLREALDGGGPQGFAFGPVVDGRTLPAHPFDPAASPVGAEVPLLIGSTETEATWNESQIYDPLTDAELREDVMRALRTDAASAIGPLHTGPGVRGQQPRSVSIIATDASNCTGTDTQAERKAGQRGAPCSNALPVVFAGAWRRPRAMHDGHPVRVRELRDGIAIVGVGRTSSRSAIGWRPGSPSPRVATQVRAHSSGRPTTMTRATMVINGDWSVVNPTARGRGCWRRRRRAVHPATADGASACYFLRDCRIDIYDDVRRYSRT
jgi:para-nitrobenzyl esterase